MGMIESALILAGGVGRRFWPLDNKSTFRFCGKPLIAYQVEYLLPIVRKIFIVAHASNFATIADIVKPYPSVQVIKQEGEGQDGAILSAASHLIGPTIISNASDLWERELLDHIETVIKSKSPDLLLVAQNSEMYFPGGYLKLNGDLVTEVVEKPNPNLLPSRFVKLVMDYYKDIHEFISFLKNNKSSHEDRYEKAISAYIKSGKSAPYILYDKLWFALKYPWHVLPLMDFFLSKIKKSHRGKNVFIHKTAVVEGPVHFGDNVKVYEYAKIEGPCFIDSDTVIGNFALVRNSMVGRKSLIGGYSEVTRSYLGNEVYLHRNYIGDSVLYNSILLGAEAVLANFRFDEGEIMSQVDSKLINTYCIKLGAIIGENVKIGVNTSVMPGIKIGSGSRVGPHQLLKRDFR